jgi:hypothetical protein
MAAPAGEARPDPTGPDGGGKTQPDDKKVDVGDVQPMDDDTQVRSIRSGAA